jgi:hypothetical protein
MKQMTLNQQDKVIIEIGVLVFIFIVVCIFTGIVFNL